MTIPKEIIEKAIAGGWEPFKTIVVSVDGSWEMIDYQTYSYAPPGRQFGEVRKNIYAIALDKTFWQALGKSCGWRQSEDPKFGDPYWVYQAELFYHFILTGQPTEQFWQEILSKQQ